MIDSQEVIERSVYHSILTVLVELGLTLDPSEYQPASIENSEKYQADKTNILTNKGVYVNLFGSSNNLTKGNKEELPKISINPQGFYPGDIGFEKNILEPSEDGETDFMVSEMPTESFDQMIDIRISCDKVEHVRILHNVINSAIPQRGYIKPYNVEEDLYSGNIFIMLSNYLSDNDLEKGIIEKVYQFTVKDTLLRQSITVDTVSKIKDITAEVNGNSDTYNK